MNQSLKLINLLEAVKKKEIGELLGNTDLNKAHFVIRPADKAVPKKEIMRTYEVRSQTNEVNGRPIDGFESLLKGLRTAETEEICVQQMISIDGTEFRLFTNIELTELIGILRK